VKLAWQDRFSVGVPEVDHEHRELIRLINLLHDALEQSQSAPRVRAALGEVHVAISAHFALEEKDMQAWGYAGYAEHKRDHERLLDELRDLMDGIEEAIPPDTNAFGARVNAWFETHFQTHDARLHGFLARQLAPGPRNDSQ
jgi:hemerythrin-like metal-binding protein